MNLLAILFPLFLLSAFIAAGLCGYLEGQQIIYEIRKENAGNHSELNEKNQASRRGMNDRVNPPVGSPAFRYIPYLGDRDGEPCHHPR